MSYRGVWLLITALLPPFCVAQVKPDQEECKGTAPGVCARHILQDEKSILTSPLHLRVSDLLWLAPIGLASGVALDYDAHAMRSLGHDTSRRTASGRSPMWARSMRQLRGSSAAMRWAICARTTICSRRQC